MRSTVSTLNDEATLKATPLRNRHVALGAKLVPFAGYEMPVQCKHPVEAALFHG